MKTPAVKPCPARLGLPHAPLNRDVRRKDGAVVSDVWYCSCGKILPTPETP